MSQENSYHDFDSLLLIDWIKASKGDLTRLRINGGTPELDELAWEKINEEHGESFATDSKHLNYLRLVKKLTILKLDLVITEDKFILNNILPIYYLFLILKIIYNIFFYFCSS